MSNHRPLTRSRSKKSKLDNQGGPGFDPAYAPPPLNIRKANALPQPNSPYHNASTIGVAVGSPKDSPLPPLPKSRGANQESFQFPFSADPKSQASAREVRNSRDSKTKGTKWKTFGSLFGRKEAANKIEVFTSVPVAVAGKSEVPNALPKNIQTSRKRAGSDKEKAMEQQNLAEAAQMTRGPSLIRRASSKRKAAQRRKPSQARVERRSARNSTVYGPNVAVSRINPRQHNLHGRQDDFSLMQIEIPNVEMERYSVMFGNVLRGSPNASRTSLARPVKSRTPESRSGSANAIKPRKDSESPQRGRSNPPTSENEGILLPPEPHKREGSVSSNSSASKPPSFSLFPSTTSSRGGSPARTATNKPLPRPSPLRSVTAPLVDNVDKRQRPALKASESDSISQPVPITPGKENIPFSKWNASHSRQGSHASVSSHDRPPSQGHVAQQDTNYHRRSHSRNFSLDPLDFHPSTTHHRPQASNASGKYLDVSEFSSSNLSLAGPAVRPPSPESHPHPLRSAKHTKQTFMSRAFPARKSSLKRMPNPTSNPIKPPPLEQAALQTSSAPAVPTRSTHDDSVDFAPPRPLYAKGAGAATSGTSLHGSSESTSSAAEVSIARQISISRRQKQHLVPVVAGARTARQPMQAVVVDQEEMARRSELVFVYSGEVSPAPDTAVRG